MFISNYSTLETADNIYNYIVDYYITNLYSPSFSEIRDFAKLKSNTSIVNYLNILQDLGYIHYDKSISRSISLSNYYIAHISSFSLDDYNLSSYDIILYNFIYNYIVKHMYSPCYQDFIDSKIINSKSLVSSRLKNLQNSGLILLGSHNSSRAIHLCHCELLSIK